MTHASKGSMETHMTIPNRTYESTKTFTFISARCRMHGVELSCGSQVYA